MDYKIFKFEKKWDTNVSNDNYNNEWQVWIPYRWETLKELKEWENINEKEQEFINDFENLVKYLTNKNNSV